jgi:hypothetical protein
MRPRLVSDANVAVFATLSRRTKSARLPRIWKESRGPKVNAGRSTYDRGARWQNAYCNWIRRAAHVSLLTAGARRRAKAPRTSGRLKRRGTAQWPTLNSIGRTAVSPRDSTVVSPA